MRVAHLSDTHLGYAEFEVRDPGTGLNVRELDVYRAFEHACRAIRDLNPDLVVHTGDLFDNPRPPNHAVVLAFQQFGSLARDGIPVAVVAGNHSLPTTRGTICILKALEAVPGVFVASEGPRTFQASGASVLAIPHIPSEKELVRVVREARPNPKAGSNILLLHAGLRGGPPRDWTEAMVPRGLIRESARRFDYVALGHYHRPMKVSPTAWYAGATERFQGDRSRGEKGFLIADLDSRQVERHSVPNRPRAELGPIDCAGLGPDEILKNLADLSSGLKAGSIVRLVLAGVDPKVYESLDSARLTRSLGRMLHVELAIHRRGGRRPRTQTWRPVSIREQFRSFAEARTEDPDLLRSVLDLANAYFGRTKEDSEA